MCLPDASPVSVTTSHPDQASHRLLVNSQADSFFLLFIYTDGENRSKQRCRDVLIQDLWFLADMIPAAAQCVNHSITSSSRKPIRRNNAIQIITLQCVCALETQPNAP